MSDNDLQLIKDFIKLRSSDFSFTSRAVKNLYEAYEKLKEQMEINSNQVSENS